MDTTKTTGHTPKKVDDGPEPKVQPKPAPPAEPSVFGNSLPDFIAFLAETWQEVRKISWPNRQQVVKETWSVLILVALITCSVLFFDWGVAKTIFEPLDHYIKKINGGVVHPVPGGMPRGIPANMPPGNMPDYPQPAPSAPQSAPSPAQSSSAPAAPSGTTSTSAPANAPASNPPKQ